VPRIEVGAGDQRGHDADMAMPSGGGMVHCNFDFDIESPPPGLEFASLIELDLCRFVGEHCASWDEISVLAQDPNVAVGSHTVSHPILRRHDSMFVAREIKECMSVIESQLGRPVRHLAFPFGDRRSVGLREFLLARDAGYLTAVTRRTAMCWSAAVSPGATSSLICE
jgi:peptidoglycan/xylan/chitin deacetylase (PgdA/CDA1 family)